MKKKQEIVWDSAKTTVENAREVLPQIAQQFFASGRKVLKKTKKLRTLHKFRIKAKSFRYTLELFQSLYGPALESRLEAVKQVQQYLGAVNDCVSIRALLDSGILKDGFIASQFHDSLKSRERQKIRKLIEYWKETFDAPGEEEKWLRYLRDYAGRPKHGQEE